MNKRVYGVLGISSIMSNWNADFSGYPKTTSDGTTFGSDKAFKYPIKKMWENQGEKVLYIKSMRFNTGKDGEVNFVPRSLKERYGHLFSIDDFSKPIDGKKILSNLFHAIDVKNFGATFAEAGTNISITGAVQIGQGLNKYENTQAFEQSILSPFRDASSKEKNADKEEAKNSTLGTKIISDEAHYFYSFTVNPLAYKEYVKLGITDGYTEVDYEKFKIASLTAATSYSTNAKAGCENEFALFIETEAELYLPNLAEFITFEKGESNNKIKIECGDMINQLENKIQSVQIYYNPNNTDIEHNINFVKCYNIFTQREV